MNKLKILSLLPAIALCSCGGAKKSKWAGTYQFRLGKSDGNHMEVTAVISDDNDPKVAGYKVMTLSADLGDQLNVMKYIEDLEDIVDDLVEKVGDEEDEELGDLIINEAVDLLPKLIAAVKEEVQNLDHIDFFYKVSQYKNEKYGERLELGTHAFADILDSIVNKHPELGTVIDEFKSLGTITGLFDDNFYIMPDVVKYAFNGFINKKGLTFQVPVSREDLNQQFFWYGYENNFLMDFSMPANYVEKMPGKKGEERFGTHPVKETKNGVVTKDEVKEVNEMFAYEFSTSPIYDKVETENEISRFVLNDEGDTKKLYMKFENNEFTPGSTIEGVVKVGADLREISLTVDANGLCNIRHNEKKGLKEGFFDNNDNEFRFNDLINDPFEFRDFNIVDVGLAKVEA